MKKAIEVKASKNFDCDLEKIWEIVTNNHNCTWRNDLSRIEIVDDEHFVEYAKNNFPTYFTIIAKERPKEYRLSMKNANIAGEWVGEFRKIDDEKVQLEFVECIETKSFIMRCFAKSYLRNQQKQYFKDLEKALKNQ